MNETYVAPPLQGHVTDPNDKISRSERRQLEESLEEIQKDTAVDVAVFLAPVGGERLEMVGRVAYAQWGIGRDWESGVLVAISQDGQDCRLILPNRDPTISAVEVTEIEKGLLELSRTGQFAQGLRWASTRIGQIERAHPRIPQARPAGTRDLGRAARFGVGAFLVILGAALVSFRRKREWERP
jgi:uncharacterized membrane protein YgcG